MNLNYIKTFAATAMMAGAFVASLPAMAVAPETIIPAESEPQETLQEFQLVFAEGAVAEWTVDGTENTPKLYRNGSSEAVGLAGPSMLTAEGNILKVTWPEAFTKGGEYELTIPAGAYQVDAQKNDSDYSFTWNVTGVKTGYSIDPAVDKVSEIQNIRITFNDNETVTLTEDWDTEHGAVLFLIAEDGSEERRGTFMPQVMGNNLNLTMNTPITDPGEYMVVVDEGTFYLDGELNTEAIKLYYTIVEPAYPEVELSVAPATDELEFIDNIEITFNGVELVEWVVTGTENAPYLEDMEGNRVATFAKLGGLGNMLSLGMYSEPFTKKGEYRVVIPEGSYVFQGIYHGMPGKEIVLNYKVLGLDSITIDPAVNVLSEIQNIKVTFNEAETVSLAEDLGTENSPLLYLINEDGNRERRGTFMPQAVGNSLLLTMNEAITEEGEYVVVVPGSTYFLDGVPGEHIEFGYTIVNDIPEPEYTVIPAAGLVESLSNFEITFNNSETAIWNYEAMESDSSLYPYISMPSVETEETVMLPNISSIDNVLRFGPSDSSFGWFENGIYNVTVPAGSYLLDGILGEQIVIEYIVDASLGVEAVFGSKDIDVYDLNGRVILRGADASALKSLRGIFVINGKKCILR